MSETPPILAYAETATRINDHEVTLTPPPPGWEIGLLSLATFFAGLGALVAVAAFGKGVYEGKAEAFLPSALLALVLIGATFWFIRAIVRRWRSGHVPWRIWRSDGWLVIDAPALYGPKPKRIERNKINDVILRRAGWSTNLRKLYRLRFSKGPRVFLTLSFLAQGPDEAAQIQQRILQMVVRQ